MILMIKKGFTLVELVIAIAVAGVIISGVVVTSAELVKRTADPMMAVQRVHTARAYLEEIQAQQFALSGADCAAPAGGRSDFTHICQYATLNDEPVTDQFGGVPPGLSGYTVSVSVSNTLVGDSNLGVNGNYVPASKTALVTVTVKSPDDSITRLSGYFVDGA